MTAFAVRSRLGSRINDFEACSAFTHVTARLFARPPEAAPCIEGFDSFVTSTAAPIATGRSDPVTGRDLHPQALNAFARRTNEVGGQPLLAKGIQPPPPEPDRPRFEASGSPVPGYAGRAVKS